MASRLSENQGKLMELIYKFKVVEIEQVYKLFKDLSPHIITININTLIKEKYIRIYQNRYLTCVISERDKHLLDTDNATCLWAIMAISCNLGDILDTMDGSAPASYLFTSNHKQAYSVVQVSELKAINIRKSQEAYDLKYQKYKEKLKLYERMLFVTDDIGLIQTINEYGLPFPYSIAYVKREKGKDLPTIKIFHSEPPQTESKQTEQEKHTEQLSKQSSQNKVSEKPVQTKQTKKPEEAEKTESKDNATVGKVKDTVSQATSTVAKSKPTVAKVKPTVPKADYTSTDKATAVKKTKPTVSRKPVNSMDTVPDTPAGFPDFDTFPDFVYDTIPDLDNLPE